jgi:hypothetical protein
MIFSQNNKDPNINLLERDSPICPPELIMSIDRSTPDIDIAKFTEYDDQMLYRFDI